MSHFKLKEVVRALKQREQNEDAEYYRFIIPFQLGLFHGFSEEKVLNMTIDEVERWLNTPSKPLKYEGWNFWWGTAAFNGNTS